MNPHPALQQLPSVSLGLLSYHTSFMSKYGDFEFFLVPWTRNYSPFMHTCILPSRPGPTLVTNTVFATVAFLQLLDTNLFSQAGITVNY